MVKTIQTLSRHDIHDLLFPNKTISIKFEEYNNNIKMLRIKDILCKNYLKLVNSDNIDLRKYVLLKQTIKNHMK